MRFKISKFYLIIPAIIVVVGVIVLFRAFDRVNDVLKQNPSEIHVNVAVDKNLFFRALDEAEVSKANAVSFYQARGAILPHHDLASRMIADFFASLAASGRQIETFVIFAPNHANVASSPAASGRILWQTALGNVRNDYTILDDLAERGFIKYDEAAIKPEHSIKNLLPFIENYFSNAKIVPLIFTSEFDALRAEAMITAIQKAAAGNNIFYLASLDFSHYLSVSKTNENDMFMKQLIEARDFVKLAKLNSDFLDSPAALITFLKAMDYLGASKMLVLDHKNSADILGHELNYSTGYYNILFEIK